MSLTRILKNILAPPLCAGCQKIGTFWCKNCSNQIEYLPYTSSNELYMAVYKPPLSKLIKTYKYFPCPELAPTLTDLLDAWLPPLKVDCITSVPLHPKKLAQRGFNQTELIAKSLAEKRNWRYLPLLERIDHSQSQAQLNRNDRKNAVHLFVPQSKNFGANINQVALLDDVITTGSTLDNCEQVLLNQGVERVTKICVATRV